MKIWLGTPRRRPAALKVPDGVAITILRGTDQRGVARFVRDDLLHLPSAGLPTAINHRARTPSSASVIRNDKSAIATVVEARLRRKDGLS